MSGGITFSSGKSWIAATWAYRHFTEQVQRHVPADDFPDLYKLLSEEENPFHFIFVEEDLNAEARQKLFSAIRLAYRDIIKTDGEGFADRDYFSNYLERLQELLDMLPDDR